MFEGTRRSHAAEAMPTVTEKLELRSRMETFLERSSMLARAERIVLREDGEGLIVRTRKVADFVRGAWTGWGTFIVVVKGLVVCGDEGVGVDGWGRVRDGL